MRNTTKRSWMLAGLVILLIILGLFAAWQAMTVSIGAGDFNAYWSASRLLLQGRNPIDPASLLEMERTHHNPDQCLMMVWNPPTLWVLMLPLAGLPFQVARVTWLLINVALVMASCLLWGSLYLPKGHVAPLLAYGLLTALFPPVLLAIWTGQMTFLVVFGVAAALFLIKRERWFWAGAALILTSVKPHLVILVVPYLLLYMAARRKWTGWLGLSMAGAMCLVVLSVLRPNWIADYRGLLDGPPVNWATPTLGGLLSLYGAGEWARYIVVAFLLLVPLLVWQSERLSPETAISVLILVTVPTTFFGWSYDHSLLLAPIAQLVGWIFGPLRSAASRSVLVAAMVVTVAANMAQRVISTEEVHFFWFPLAWGGIYALASYLRRKTSKPSLP